MREKIKKEKKGKLGMLLIMSAIASFYAIFFAKDLFYYRSALSIVLGLSAAGAVVFLSGLYRNTGRVEDFKASMKQMSLTLLFLSVMIVGASLICGLISFIIYSCMNGGSNLSDIKAVIALVIGIFLFLITPFFISVFFSVAKGTGSFKEEFKKGIIPGVLRYAKLAIIQASAFFAGFGIEKGMYGDNVGILKALIYTAIGFVVFLLSAYICGSTKNGESAENKSSDMVEREMRNAKGFANSEGLKSAGSFRRKLSGKLHCIAFKGFSIWLLILCLSGVAFPLSAFAEEPAGRRVDFTAPDTQTQMNTEDTKGDDDTDMKAPVDYYESDDEIQGQLIAVDEYSKTYKTGDKAYVTQIDGVANTFDKNGESIYIDNTLVEKGSAYENKTNSYTVKLPKEINSGKGVKVEKDGYAIEMLPLEGDFTHSVVKDNAIIYNKVFENTDFQYTALNSTIKEDIVLNAYTEKNEYSFKINPGNLSLKEIGGVIFAYDKREISSAVKGSFGQEPTKEQLNSYSKFTITAPVMQDAAGEVSFAVNLTLSKEEGEYIAKVSASKKWLSDPARVYPVRIDPTISPVVITDIGMYGVEEGHGDMVIGDNGYPYCGYDDGIASQNWVDSGTMHMRTRTYMKVNYDFSKISKEARIDSAKLDIYQMTRWSNGNTNFGLYKVGRSWDPSNLTWNSQISFPHEFISFSKSLVQTGYISWDIRETVNEWVQGISNNNGLVLKAEDEKMQCEVFHNHTHVNPPRITIHWTVPDPVDTNYPLDKTTINLRPITENDIKGKLKFDAVFPDGLAKPESLVGCMLNPDNIVYVGPASLSYKYPDSFLFSDAFKNGTRYKDKLSNWQGTLFTNPAFDKMYYYTATAAKDNVVGKEVTSDKFLIYKVKELDTFPYIASHYGVPLNTIMRDNRVQDTLLVKNNTIFVRNPKTSKAYNPAPKDMSAKRKIDSALMGRGLHCEYGLEPVNLNTGNFFLEATDVSLDDYNEFKITRSYNSKASDNNSVFGYGWAFSYAKTLSKDEEGNIIYRDGDGKRLEFKTDGKGGYKSPDGYFYELKEESYEREVESFDADPEKRGKKVKHTFYRYVLTKPNGEKERFNAWGMLESVTDANGFATSFKYDGDFNLTGIDTPSGASFKISTDAAGRITSITRPDGKRLKYTYDSSGRLIKYTNANGYDIKYTYNDKDLMTAWHDANGARVVLNEYDSEGRVIKQTDANGGVSRLEYTKTGTVTTDAKGNKTKYTVDSLMRTTKIEYPNGKVVSNTYDKDNKLVTSDGEKYSYDSKGNRLSITRKDGSKYSYTYDAKGNVTSVTDPAGNKTLYTYSSNDLTEVTYATGESERFTYNKNHQPVSHTDANGNTEKYSYSGALLSSYTDKNGNTYKFFYDKMNNLTSSQNPDGGVSRKTLDAEGNIKSEQAPDGGMTTYSLDKNGNPVKQIDPEGAVTLIGLDKMSNIISVTDARGNKCTYAYDKNGNRTKETDAEGNSYSHGYDSRNRLVETIAPDGGVTRYEYDKEGNIIKLTNPDGSVRSAVYDSMNNPTVQTDTLGRSTSITYTKTGQIDTITKPGGESLKYVYDKRDRLISFTDESGIASEFELDGEGNTLTLKEEGVKDENGNKNSQGNVRYYKYVYDKNANLLSEENPLGEIKRFSYDSMNRVLKEINEENSETLYTYDKVGRLISSIDPEGGITKNEYNKKGNVIKTVDALGNENIYNYDSVGNLISTKDAEGNITNFTYDKNNKLKKKIDALKGETSYEYSVMGQVSVVTDANGNQTDIFYDKKGNVIKTQLPTKDTISFEYDSEGNKLKSTDAAGLITEYVYDEGNRVTLQKDNAGNKENYLYDEYGRLTEIIYAGSLKENIKYNCFSEPVSVKGTDGNETKYEYDPAGRLTSETDAESKSTRYMYDKTGLLTELRKGNALYKYGYNKRGELTYEINPLGIKTLYSYDLNGNVTDITDGNGVKTTYAYDGLNRLIKETDGKGNESSFSYDPLGRLSVLTDPLGGTKEYRYDGIGNITKVKDEENRVTEYIYDSLGNLIQEISPKGAKSIYEYNKHNEVIKVTNPLGNITESVIDLNGLTTKKIQANGGKYSYEYDDLKRLVSVTTPNGYKKNLEYDGRGDIVKESDNLNREIKYEYDLMHRQTKVINPKGAASLFEYDANGNITGITDSKNKKTSYKYDLTNQLKEISDSQGKKTRYNYDRAGNITEVIKPGNRKTSYAYDNNYNVISVTDPLGNVTGSEYDKKNRLINVINPAGENIKYKYDAVGNVTGVTDAKGKTYKYEYDAHNNIRKAINRLGGETKFDYDLTDNLTGVTDPAGRVNEYKYDSMGNLTKVRNAMGETKTFTYDLEGNITSFTDITGNTEKYSYDLLGNMTELIRPNGDRQTYDYDKINNLIEKGYISEDGKKNSVTYLYDSQGNRTEMQDFAGTSTYEYDSLGRVIAATDSTGKEVRYEYDGCDRLSKIIYPTGKEVSYEYDKNDRLIGVKESNRESVKETRYSYDAVGRLTDTKRFDASVSTYEYNERDELIKLKNIGPAGKVLSEFVYEYNPEGNIEKETATDEAGKKTIRTYKYNAVDELKEFSETTGGQKILYKYEYDDTGNRTKLTKSGAEKEIIEYEYKAGRLMSEKSSLYGETKYDYNKNGDLVCETGASSTRSYEYTVESRLKAVREGGEILMAAAYDGDGNRTLQVTRRERMIERDAPGSYEDVSSGSGEDVGSDDKKDAAKKDEKKEKKVNSKEDRESTQKEDISFNAFLYGFLHGLMEFFAELNSSLLTLLSDLLNNSFSYGSAGYTASDIKALSAAGLSMSDIKNITGIRRLDIVSEEDVIPEEESIEDKVFIPGKHYDIKETYYDLTEYVNDTNRDNTEVLEEYGQGGILKSTHVYGNERISTSVSATSDSIIADITGVATVRNDMSANDFNISSSAYDMSYLYDGRGSVAQTISGNVIKGRFNYDPFGSTITKVSQTDNYYGYNAEETNSVTGLQYLRARYYNSDTGRFFNADTYLGDITAPLSMNRYAYTQNNPLNYTDPSGHAPNILNTFLYPWLSILPSVGKKVGTMVGKAVEQTKKQIRKKQARAAEKQLQAYTSGVLSIGAAMAALAGGGSSALVAIGAVLGNIRKKYCGEAETYAKLDDIKAGKPGTTDKGFITGLLNDGIKTLAQYAPKLNMNSQIATVVDPVSGTRLYYELGIEGISLHYPAQNPFYSQVGINNLISNQQQILADLDVGINVGNLKKTYGKDEIIYSATSTKGNSTYSVSIGISLESKTVKAEYSVSTKVVHGGQVTSTYGIESRPSNSSKNKYSYQANKEVAFKEKTLNNTTWETAGKPTTIVIGTLGGIIFFGAGGVVIGFFGVSGLSHAY